VPIYMDHKVICKYCCSMFDTVMYRYCSCVDDKVKHKFCNSVDDKVICKYCYGMVGTVMYKYCSHVNDNVMDKFCSSMDDKVMCRYCSRIFGCSSTPHSHFFSITLGKFNFLVECYSFRYKSFVIIPHIVILTSKASIFCSKNMLPDE